MREFRAGWYLIYTKPRHEKKVHRQLAERNIHAFLPTTRKVRDWNDRKKLIDEPLFPSYVFIYLDNMQDYYDGMDADGSLYYVRTGKEIAKVSDAIINNIKLAAGQCSDIEVSADRFHPCQQLVISKGALTGLSCEVVDHNGKSRLLVRVDLLQRNLLLTLPEEHLAAIN